MTHILTPKQPLKDHCLYIFADINSNTFCGANSLLTPFKPYPIGTGIYLWELTDRRQPLSFYLNHPDVTIYTPNSHPEYFL